MDAAMRAHYAQGREAARLEQPNGVLEFARTTEIVLRALPTAPATVADVGGGPGRYSAWLAGRGYRVEHRDLVPDHVAQAARIDGVQAALGDARALDLADGSVDAVLLFGPLYHLVERADRVRALREAGRVVRAGGPVFVAVISRWAPRLDGLLSERLYREHPYVTDLVDATEASGVLPPFADGSFCGWTHRPQELVEEIADAGLRLADLVGVEGLPLAADDLAARWADDLDRAIVLDAARAIERVPELLGLSPHLVATAYSGPAAG